MLLDSFVKVAFDFEVLDDCFDDQIAVFQFREIVFEVSDADERGVSGVKNAAGLAFFAASKPARAIRLRTSFGFERQSLSFAPPQLIRAARCRAVRLATRRWRGARRFAPPSFPRRELLLFQFAFFALYSSSSRSLWKSRVGLCFKFLYGT